MRNRNNERLDEITDTTIIICVDIAKAVDWARFVDYRGKEICKAVSFTNDRQGFDKIISKTNEILNVNVYDEWNKEWVDVVFQNIIKRWRKE